MKLFDSTFNRWIAHSLHKFLTVMPAWITPNRVSILGAIVSMCALFIGVAQNNLVLLCWLSLACLVFDVLDGQLARFRHNQTHFGKLLDAGIDIALSICIVISLLVLEKNILLYIGLFLIILYVFRFVAVVKNCEKEIGGLRPSLIIGLLTTFYLQIPINIILSIFLVWNAISALLSVADYVTSGNKNSAGI